MFSVEDHLSVIPDPHGDCGLRQPHPQLAQQGVSVPAANFTGHPTALQDVLTPPGSTDVAADASDPATCCLCLDSLASSWHARHA